MRITGLEDIPWPMICSTRRHLEYKARPDHRAPTATISSRSSPGRARGAGVWLAPSSSSVRAVKRPRRPGADEPQQLPGPASRRTGKCLRDNEQPSPGRPTVFATVNAGFHARDGARAEAGNEDAGASTAKPRWSPQTMPLGKRCVGAEGGQGAAEGKGHRGPVRRARCACCSRQQPAIPTSWSRSISTMSRFARSSRRSARSPDQLHPHGSVTGTVTVMSPTPFGWRDLFLPPVDPGCLGYATVETDNAVKIVPRPRRPGAPRGAYRGRPGGYRPRPTPSSARSSPPLRQCGEIARSSRRSCRPGSDRDLSRTNS